MDIRQVSSDGRVFLGLQAEAYFGRMVQISRLSSGSILITLDDTPVLFDLQPRLIPAKHKELPGG